MITTVKPKIVYEDRHIVEQIGPQSTAEHEENNKTQTIQNNDDKQCECEQCECEQCECEDKVKVKPNSPEYVTFQKNCTQAPPPSMLVTKYGLSLEEITQQEHAKFVETVQSDNFEVGDPSVCVWRSGAMILK